MKYLTAYFLLLFTAVGLAQLGLRSPAFTKPTIGTAAAGGGEFSPTDIADLHIWVDASALSGYSNDDSVGYWPDESGNGNAFTNITSGQQPLYKTGIQNSLPALLFDNTDDGMTNLATDTLISANGYTIFLVEKNDAIVSGSHRTLDSMAGNALIAVSTRGSSGNGAYVESPVWNDTAFDETNTAHTVWLKLNNGASEFYINGTNVTDGASANSNWQRVALGDSGAASETCAAYICELVIYTNALNATETTNVFEYLQSKWGTPDE